MGRWRSVLTNNSHSLSETISKLSIFRQSKCIFASSTRQYIWNTSKGNTRIKEWRRERLHHSKHFTDDNFWWEQNNDGQWERNDHRHHQRRYRLNKNIVVVWSIYKYMSLSIHLGSIWSVMVIFWHMVRISTSRSWDNFQKWYW